MQDAHLVVISGDHARSLPRQLRNWLEQWATHRRIKQAAVGVIDESDNPAFAVEDFCDLERLVDEHGLNLITGENRAVRQHVEIFSRTQYRKLPVSIARRERY